MKTLRQLGLTQMPRRDLEKECAKLISRIEKLREGLAEIHKCGMDAHASGDQDMHSFKLGEAAGIAHRILQLDKKS